MERQTHEHTSAPARRRQIGMVAVVMGAILLLIALMSAMAVSADVPDAAAANDNSNAKANWTVPEGLDATRYAQPPPPTARQGILGVYYPFYQLNPTAVTYSSPTPPPFAGVQEDHSAQRFDEHG